MLENLTAGRLLARNTIWNLVGEGAPLAVGVFAIPILVHALGTGRFGILMIVWMIIGYLSLFDLGMGRALTNLVAQKLGSGEEQSLPPLIWTANALLLGLAVTSGVLLAACSHWVVFSVLKIPDDLKRESLISLYILSGALPAVILSSGLRGVLEAYQRFDTANIVRIPMGVWSFAGPLAVLPFSHSLVPVVAILTVGRYLGATFYFIAGRALLPVMRSAPQWDSAAVRPLLTFGGWMTVSNVIAPIMASMDRFLVGALVSVQAVAYYATPEELTSKLLILPGAIAAVLFPAFSTTLKSDVPRSERLYLRSVNVIAATMGFIVLAVILGAKFGLRIWLGPVFAANSAVALQILAAGVFFNSIAQAPFALIQGAGHAAWTGKLHLVELPCYLAMFWLLTQRFGINGTAIAWSVRATVDCFVLWGMAGRLLSKVPILTKA